MVQSIGRVKSIQEEERFKYIILDWKSEKAIIENENMKNEIAKLKEQNSELVNDAYLLNKIWTKL